MTNMIITPNQTQSKCPEDSDIIAGRCVNNSDCPFKVPVKLGNGELLHFKDYHLKHEVLVES